MAERLGCLFSRQRRWIESQRRAGVDENISRRFFFSSPDPRVGRIKRLVFSNHCDGESSSLPLSSQWSTGHQQKPSIPTYPQPTSLDPSIPSSPFSSLPPTLFSRLSLVFLVIFFPGDSILGYALPNLSLVVSKYALSISIFSSSSPSPLGPGWFSHINPHC